MATRSKLNRSKYPETLEFQAIEWLDYNEKDDIDDKCEEYKIRAFGTTKNGESVCVTINDYTPFFYLKVANDFTNSDLKKLLNFLARKNNNFYKHLQNCYEPNIASKKKWIWETFHINNVVVSKCKILHKKDFIGFTNGEMSKFVRLTFKNTSSSKFCIYNVFNNSSNKITIEGKAYTFKLYESSIEPLLRFFHIKDIKPCGWIGISKYSKSSYSKCQIDVSCNWMDIFPIEETNVANFLQCSFDIEVYSKKDGDLRPFPSPGVVKVDKYIPNRKYNDNVIFQIASCFKYRNDDNM